MNARAAGLFIAGLVAALLLSACDGRAPILVGGTVTGSALSGDRLYLADGPGGRVLAVDPVRGSIPGTLRGLSRPTAPAVVPGDGRLFTAEPSRAAVAVVDLPALRLDRRLSGPYITVAVNPDAGRLFAARRGRGIIDVYDTATLAKVGDIATTLAPVLLAVDPARRRLVAVTCDLAVGCRLGTSQLEVLDLVSRGPMGSVSLGDGVTDLVLDATNGLAYVSSACRGYPVPGCGRGEISVVDVTSGRLRQRYSPGSHAPSALAVDPARGRLWSVDRSTGGGALLAEFTTSPSLRPARARLPVATGARSTLDLAVDRTRSRAYVVNAPSGFVSVIDLATFRVVTGPLTAGG